MGVLSRSTSACALAGPATARRIGHDSVGRDMRPGSSIRSPRRQRLRRSVSGRVFAECGSDPPRRPRGGLAGSGRHHRSTAAAAIGGHARNHRLLRDFSYGPRPRTEFPATSTFIVLRPSARSRRLSWRRRAHGPPCAWSCAAVAPAPAARNCARRVPSRLSRWRARDTVSHRLRTAPRCKHRSPPAAPPATCGTSWSGSTPRLADERPILDSDLNRKGSASASSCGFNASSAG